MRNSSSEVIDCAAETVPDVDAIRLPVEPVKRAVVPAAICAEGQGLYLRLRVVRVVDAHERRADAARCVVHDLIVVKRYWELVALWYQVDIDEAIVLITQL